ncbi:MAG: hypothetical protein E6I75_23600, partial [Chloroflexi bacterium]
GTWSDFVATNLVIDTALTTLLSAAVEVPYEPLRQRARKIQQEEAGHWTHAAGWLRRPSISRTDLAASLARVWDDAFTWFGQPDDPVVTRVCESSCAPGSSPSSTKPASASRSSAASCPGTAGTPPRAAFAHNSVPLRACSPR